MQSGHHPITDNINQPTSNDEKVEALINKAIEKKDITLLKEVCDLYKKSQSMHPTVVKCHIIYMAIKLNLDIQDELKKWDHLSKNSDLNLHVYLLNHFMPPYQQDLIKLGKAYRALKDLLSFFTFYENDENFKKQLKIHYNDFQTDDALSKCIDAHRVILNNKISNDKDFNDHDIEILNNYIHDYLWIIDVIPKVETEIYKRLLQIKYDMYLVLVNYDSSKFCDLFIEISQFYSTNEYQFYVKRASLVRYCETKWKEEDNFPNKSVLEKRQSMCKAALNDSKLLILNFSKNIEYEKILKIIIRSIALYINYEFLLSENDITINKLGLYNYYKKYLENFENDSLDASIHFCCKSIFMNTNSDNIEKTKKIMSDLLSCNTNNKNIKNKIKNIKKCMKKYSDFYTIENKYKALNLRNVKEYKNSILEIKHFLEELRNDPNMHQFKELLENRALFLDAFMKSRIAYLTKDKENIESAKKALLKYNKNNNISVDFTNFCEYRLLKIKFYEIIPTLKNNKKLFVENLTDPVICKYLTSYLLDTIKLFLQQKLDNSVPDYDNSKSLSENFLINFEIIKNQINKNSVKKIDIFLVGEAMLELLEDSGLKERYSNLYNTLIKNHLKNIINLLDEEKTAEAFYLYKFYIERYKSISHDDNEDHSVCINIYLKYYDLIKTDKDDVDVLIDDAIYRFPSVIKFFQIKLSLLKDYVCPVLSNDNEELIAPILPDEKISNITNKSNNYKRIESQRETAYKNLKDKQEDLINCQKKYPEEKENLLELRKEIINLYELIKQIDINHITSDDVRNILEFNEKNIAFSKKIEEFQDTTEKLQKETKEFAAATIVYESYDKKLDELRKAKEVEIRKNAIIKAKTEQTIAKKKVEQKKKEVASAKKKVDQTRKLVETKTQAAEKAREREAKARKEIVKAQEQEAKAKTEAAAKAREEKEKAVTAAKAREEAAKAREKSEKAEKVIAKAREGEAKAKIILAKTREEEEKAKIKVDKAREEEEKAKTEVTKTIKEEENAKTVVTKTREEEKAKAIVIKAREPEVNAMKEAEKARVEEAKAEEEVNKSREEEAKVEEAIQKEIKKEIKKERLLNGEGSKISGQDLADIYKLHKELESKGIKLKITGSFAARLFIYFYNPTKEEIAKLFSVKDIDLVIPYYKDYLNNVRNFRNYEDCDLECIKGIISENGYDVENKKTTIETLDFINVKRTKLKDNDDGIDFDLSVEKSPLNSVDKFMPFHFLHLEMIEKDQIKADDKTISIGDYHFKFCVKEGFEKEVEKACKLEEFVVLKPEDHFRHYSYSVYKYLSKLLNCVKYLGKLSNGSPNNLTQNVIKQYFSPEDKDDPLIEYYINKSKTKVGLFYEEMKRFAIEILEGKITLVRPFIINFYFTLIVNEVDFRINRAQTRGYSFISPSVEEFHQFSSECTHLFINNNNNILENARNPNYSFNDWKRNVNNIIIKKLDEYEQAYRDQLLHQSYSIQQQQQQQEYQFYHQQQDCLPQQQKCQQFTIQQQRACQQVLTQQQQKCQQFLIQQQEECQQFLNQQQQENQPYLIQQQKCQQFLIHQQQKCQQFINQQQQGNKQFLFQQQQECQQFLSQQQENQQFLIQQHQHNQQFLIQQHQNNQQFLIQQSQQFLLQQTQFYLNVIQQQRESQQRYQLNECQHRQQTNLNQQQNQPLSNSLSAQTPAFYPQIQQSNLTLPSHAQFFSPQLQQMQAPGLSQNPHTPHSVPRQSQQMQPRGRGRSQNRGRYDTK